MEHYDQATMDAAVSMASFAKFQYQMQHHQMTAGMVNYGAPAIMVNGINIHEYAEINAVESLTNGLVML